MFFVTTDNVRFADVENEEELLASQPYRVLPSLYCVKRQPEQMWEAHLCLNHSSQTRSEQGV